MLESMQWGLHAMVVSSRLVATAVLSMCLVSATALLPAHRCFAPPRAPAPRCADEVPYYTEREARQLKQAQAALARAAGCHYPVVRSEQSFVDEVMRVSDGEGCAVVYEAIGKDTLQQSLDSLRPMGVCAAYGHVSGPPDPVDIIQDLGRRGSLFITRPAIMHYVAKRSDLEWTAKDLFAAMGNGILDANINYEYALKDAVTAHRAIESGTTSGATVLIP